MKLYYLNIFIVLFLFSTNISIGQNVSVFSASGKEVIEWNVNIESKVDAQERVFELAKRNLLANAFPTQMSVQTEMEIKNRNEGNNVDTETSIKVSSESIVKGEIIKITKKEFKDHLRKENKTKVKYIECIIEAKVRKLENERIAIQTFTMSDSRILVPKKNFKEGDNLYVYFQSPVSGYLNIFVEAEEMVQRIFPYSQYPSKFENGAEVIADKDYILFSQNHDYFDQPKLLTDELELFLENKELETNKVYVIFSKSPITKPVLKPNQKLEGGSYLPPSLSKKAFEAWKFRNLSSRADMQIHDFFIEITK